MTTSIPMSIVYAGLVGTLLSLIVATAQQKWQWRVFWLLALRLAIGWQFLFEGLHKLNSHYVGVSETNKPFTSEPYFKAAPTKFGDMMRVKFDNPRAVIEARLTQPKPMTAAEFEKLSVKDQAELCPESLRKEFDELLEATEANVKAVAASDKTAAGKVATKEISDAEDALRIASAAEKQNHLNRVTALQTAHWKELAGIDEVAKRKERKDAFEKFLQDVEKEHQEKLKRLTADFEKKKATAGESKAKKEQAADEKSSKYKEIAAEQIESAKASFAAWVYGAAARESKVKFTTGDASLTVPQRLAHLAWLKSEAQAAQERAGSGIGKGNGVEVKRAAELRMELITAETELAKEAYAADLKKALTGKDWEIPRTNAEGLRMDRITMWFIAIVGACLLFGCATRLSCLLAAGFLVMTYLTHPAVPWYPLPPNTEGNPLFINKNVIECFALLALACFPTGSWLGLDAICSWLFLPKRNTAKL